MPSSDARGRPTAGGMLTGWRVQGGWWMMTTGGRAWRRRAGGGVQPAAGARRAAGGGLAVAGGRRRARGGREVGPGRRLALEGWSVLDFVHFEAVSHFSSILRQRGTRFGGFICLRLHKNA